MDTSVFQPWFNCQRACAINSNFSPDDEEPIIEDDRDDDDVDITPDGSGDEVVGAEKLRVIWVAVVGVILGLLM